MREAKGLTPDEIQILNGDDYSLIEATDREVASYLDGSGPDEDVETVVSILDSERHNVFEGGGGTTRLVVIRIVPHVDTADEDTASSGAVEDDPVSGDDEVSEHTNLNKGDDDAA